MGLAGCAAIGGQKWAVSGSTAKPMPHLTITNPIASRITVRQDDGCRKPRALQLFSRRRTEARASTTRTGTSFGSRRKTLWPMTAAAAMANSAALSQRDRGEAA